ncbi:MAG: tRNA (N6-threonylcarbamoyladenosine(37)-N6)-methyltransferase TrmO [Oscillospiraceae bacterium]|nr:tRNA (N6-threonylcarbamoyladenosine(37)-N6)-methyltransferase TrmO [Oscillospiraceae bacterium]
MKEKRIEPIARIKTDFPGKFGIPRQSGIAGELEGIIEFEKDYADREAIRGIEEFTHLWLIWGFSENESWSPTVRPPRLGGNVRKGVFATRSPFRPNGLGLSCVRLLRVEDSGQGMPKLIVGGVDLMDGTPIYDIKPYIPYADSIPDASSGFAPDPGKSLEVIIPEELEVRIPTEKRAALRKVLSLDPRPQYLDEGDREYGFGFAGFEIRFTVADGTVRVLSAEKTE